MSNLVPHNRRNHFFRPFNMFDDFFNDSWYPLRNITGNFKIDVKEENDSYVVEAELPGINKEDVFLELNEGRLLISVEQKEETNEDNKKYIHRERRYSTMQRSIYLGDVKSDGIIAKLDNGLLKIRIQKDESKPASNRIEIQ